MLDWYKARKEEVRIAFDGLCPGNAQMISSTIQKALAKSCADGVRRAIKQEMGDNLFSVLIDESRDISVKEQMALVVRYMSKGEVIERFLGIKHVKETTTEALKKALVEVLAIDAITTELDHRFNDMASELLCGFACLDPRDSFSKFDLDKVAKLTDIYDADFSNDDRKRMKTELQLFINHMRRHDDFRVCYDLASLAKKMFELERNIMFPLVYRLIELGMLLPVATTSVERAFSAMKIIKTDLRSKMSNGWLDDLMVCYIEREIFKGLDLAEIKKEFQHEGRRMPLPRST
ncbi:hypothetical protein VPH35_048062 [Triticum aestivum]